MWQISLLGDPEIHHDGRLIDLACSNKARALFYFLVAEQRLVNRKDLATLLWDEFNLASAQNNLRNALFHLRKEVDDCLEIQPRHVRFRCSEPIELDINTFLSVHSGSPVEDLVAAVDCYRGEFLANFSLEDAPRFDNWLKEKREYFRRSAVGYMLQLAISYDRQDRLHEGLEITHRILEIQPYNEGAIFYRLQFYNRLGMPYLADQEFNDYSHVLKKYNLALPAESIKTLLNRARKPHSKKSIRSLPRRVSPFFGRTGELEYLNKRIIDRDCPIVNLAGGIGMGKTRLAVEIGERLKDVLPDGVLYANLMDIRDWQAENIQVEITRRIFQALDTPFNAQDPLFSQLVEILRDQDMLLILDNFISTPASIALLNRLVQKTDHIQLLVTSYEPVRMPDIVVVALSGLEYPTPEEIPAGFDIRLINRYPSLALFEKSAMRSTPSFSINPGNWKDILHICQFFQGMPLGIELCASQVYTRSPAQIVELLEKDLKEKQEPDGKDQLLWNLLSIARSEWATIPEQYRSPVAACTIFQGGFTSEAFSAVTGEHDSLLHIFVDKNIVQTVSPYYFSLRTFVRSFLEGINVNIPGKVSASYCRYYLEQVTVLDSIRTPEPEGILFKIARDQANIEHAWQLAISLGEYELVQRVCSQLTSFLKRLGKLNTAYDLLNQAEQQLKSLPGRESIQEQTLAVILFELSRLEEIMGNLDRASEIPEEIILIAQSLGDSKLSAAGNLRKAAICFLRHNTLETIRYSRLGIEAAHQSNDIYMVGRGYVQLGMAYTFAHQYEEAISVLNIGLKERAFPANTRVMEMLHYYAASCYLFQGKLADAQKFMQKSLEISRSIMDLPGLRMIKFVDAQICKVSGRLDQSQSRFEESLALHDSLGQWRLKCNTLANLAVLKLWENAIQDAYRLINEAEGTSRRYQLTNLPDLLILKGRILLSLGRLSHAEWCVRKAGSLLESNPDTEMINLHLNALMIDILIAWGRTQEAVDLSLEVLPSIRKTDYNFPEDPFTLYAAVYQALKAAGHPSAVDVLEEARLELARLADQVDSPEAETDLLNVPARRALNDLIAKEKENSTSSHATPSHPSWTNPDLRQGTVVQQNG